MLDVFLRGTYRETLCSISSSPSEEETISLLLLALPQLLSARLGIKWPTPDACWCGGCCKTQVLDWGGQERLLEPLMLHLGTQEYTQSNLVPKQRCGGITIQSWGEDSHQSACELQAGSRYPRHVRRGSQAPVHTCTLPAAWPLCTQPPRHSSPLTTEEGAKQYRVHSVREPLM